MFRLIGFLVAVAIGVAALAHADVAERTVRTGIGPVSRDTIRVDNAAALYQQTLNILVGRLSEISGRATLAEARLEDLRRRINNLATVNYVTEFNSLDAPYELGSHSADDGGGCGF